MTSTIDGLVSGLDTTSLITSLLQIEAAPQTLLKTKQDTTSKLVTALQALNTKTAALAETATKAATATSWAAATATASVDSVTAVAGDTAVPGTVSFRVDAVAQSQVSLSDVTADDGTLVPDYPPAVTIKGADGTYVTVEPTTGSLADIANAINKATDAGIRATVIRVGDGQYRIQFTGTLTGATNGFEVYAGDQAAVEAGTATRIDGNLARGSSDASITLWSDDPTLSTTITQASNTFSDLMTGVDVTVGSVTAADEDPVTVTVEQDDAAVTELAKNLVDGLGLVLSEIASRTSSTTTTASDGRTVVSGGLFSGDSGIRMMRERLISAASQPVDGLSPSTVGIELGSDGTFSFDEEAFAAALAEDPVGVQSLVSQLAQRVADVAEGASDPNTGSLSLQIKGQQNLVTDYGKQIENWDLRLELRRTTLEKQYAALEVALSNMQAQQAWLTSQLDQLSANSQSS